jgi:hypothetical protein
MPRHDESLPIKNDVLPWIEKTVSKRGEDLASPLNIWEFPILGSRYVLGVIVGESRKEDSVIHAIRIDRGLNPDIQVFEWRGQIDAVKLSRTIYSLAKFYNEALVAIEVSGASGTGELCQWNLLKLGYQNIFRWKNYGPIGDCSSCRHALNSHELMDDGVHPCKVKGCKCKALKQKQGMADHYGWITNVRTRDMLIANARRWLNQHLWSVRSPKFLEEARTWKTDESIRAGMIAIFCAHESDYEEKSA